MSVLPLHITALGPVSGFSTPGGGDGGDAVRPLNMIDVARSLLRRHQSRPGAQEADPSIDVMASAPLDQQSDEDLLAAYLGGRREAFRVLMERYRNELNHFLTRFLGSRAAADDVFQETFLQVHLSGETFDPTRRFKPWLFTIAANKARDYHRRNTRRQPLSLSASIGREGDSQSFVDLLEADLPSPDAPLADAERSRMIRTVVDEMPVHLREILLMSYFQRLSYNQIADSLEIPLGTVKSRLHTAVATFAKLWKSQQSPSSTGGGDDGDVESGQ